MRKWIPQLSKMEQKGAQSEPTEAKRSPKGKPREPKGSPKGAKGSPKGATGEPKDDPNALKRSTFSQGRENYEKKIGAGSIGWVILGAQIDVKIDAKIDGQKVMKNDEQMI